MAALEAPPRAGARTPGEATRAFAALISDGDVKRASDSFVRDACFVTPDRTAVRGRSRIRSVLTQLTDSGVELEVSGSTALVAGDVALVHESWVFTFNGSEGLPYCREGCAAIVLRQFEEGWKLALVAPAA